MDDDRIGKYRDLVNGSLDAAEEVWKQARGRVVEAKAIDLGTTTSDIPGFPSVAHLQPGVGEFVALIADQRKSSEHLNAAISSKDARVSQLERVLYQSAAVLSSWGFALALHGGNVTEFLGDGLLALFGISSQDKRAAVMSSARDAAIECLESLRLVVNPVIESRYGLPPLHAGVGLGLSQCVVTLVGTPTFRQPKAIGQCIYRASKLSKGVDEVCVDKQMDLAWPTSKGGKLRFLPRKLGGHEGFCVYPQ